MRQERDDGLATLEWVVKQPWFGTAIVLLGGSYLGYVQWAVADRLPPEAKAMVPQVTESALTLEFLRKDGMSLETPFRWGIITDGQERRGALLRQLLSGRRKTGPCSRFRWCRPTWPPPGIASPMSRTSSATMRSLHGWSGIDHSDRVAARHRAGELDRRLV